MARLLSYEDTCFRLTSCDAKMTHPPASELLSSWRRRVGRTRKERRKRWRVRRKRRMSGGNMLKLPGAAKG